MSALAHNQSIRVVGVHPLVSFVIPVRNDAVRLQHCLDSIVANVYPRDRIELIVVDHGSTDASAASAAAAGAVVLAGATGKTVAELRNQGAREARGEVTVFVDADHQIGPQWIRTSLEILADPRVAATGSVYSPQPMSNWVQRQYDSLRRRPQRREDVTWLASGSLAVKSECFRDVGGFNVSLTACEDVDLCNRLRRAGHRLVTDPGLVSVHFGDPSTLKALFLGELWRGRDNVRVTLSGPWTFRDLRSVLPPIVTLASLVAAVVSLAFGNRLSVLFFLALALLAPAARTIMLLRRHASGSGLQSLGQAIAFALVFDLARALALVTRASHRARRAA